MGEFLDRVRQRELLMELRSEYPHKKFYVLAGDEAGRGEAVNLHYLLEHGLIDGRPHFSSSGDKSSRWQVRITHQGLDFLADDGGLGAILGVVIVKLHDDTVRDLLMARVDADDSTDVSSKAKLKDAIRGLPADVLSTAVKEAMKAGLSHIGNIGDWIHHLQHLVS